MNYTRRFVFVHYDDLLDTKFRTLEQITDKLFVLLPASVGHVPVRLVQQLQTLGPKLHWIELSEEHPRGARHVLAFELGRVHEQVDPGVEFAVLSEDEELDTLVDHMKRMGRACVRVRHRAIAPSSVGSAGRSKSESTLYAEPVSPERVKPTTDPTGVGELGNRPARPTESNQSEATPGRKEVSLNSVKAGSSGSRRQEIERAADELIRRLIRSGNRPDSLALLRAYAALQLDRGLDKSITAQSVVRHLLKQGEIRKVGEELIYTF